MSNSQIGMLIYIAQLKYGGSSLLTLNDRTWLYIICLLDVWYLCDLQIFDAWRCKDAAAAEKWRMKCKKPWAEFANIKPENILNHIKIFQKHIGYIYIKSIVGAISWHSTKHNRRHVDLRSAQPKNSNKKLLWSLPSQQLISWQIHMRFHQILLFDVLGKLW